ncbi:hypothetical protein [Bifidobacterium parmae]|uniref:Uncharacterized protein n=1 Tax=Bifidobacterium parmae TaxID=361854 RepID=A0A2N5J4Q3_9BIFI|nr:hypothetical protein [Bifidobacterium parmae]PLS29191.1 hypothetical protein Uis4E_0611 [Bifidobacterium parmae]
MADETVVTPSDQIGQAQQQVADAQQAVSAAQQAVKDAAAKAEQSQKEEQSKSDTAKLNEQIAVQTRDEIAAKNGVGVKAGVAKTPLAASADGGVLSSTGVDAMLPASLMAVMAEGRGYQP